MIRVDVSKGIKLGGHQYKVSTGGHVNERLQEGKYYGRCYSREKEILIDNSWDESQVSNSILHEILHAIDDVFVNNGLRESQIRSITNGLHQVFEDCGVRFIAGKPAKIKGG